MPVDVHDTHRNDPAGQVTVREVVVEDATGSATTYEFQQQTAGGFDPDGWEYLGDGSPTDTALQAAQDGPAADGGEDA